MGQGIQRIPLLAEKCAKSRENIARMKQLLLVPGCKWPQNKVDKKFLPHLLLWNKQLSEGKGLGKGIENQSMFFARNTNRYFRKASLDMEPHTGTSCHTKAALLFSRATAAVLGCSWVSELQIRHSLLSPLVIQAQGNVHNRATTDLWWLHSHRFQGEDVRMSGLAVSSTYFPCY